MDKGKHQSSEVQKVFQTEWFSIDAVPYPCSSKKPYFRLSMNDSVEIMAVTPDEKIILVRQFRPALGVVMLELPAGQADRGESCEEAISRELKEETGYVCDSVTYLGPFRIAPSRINNTLHLFFGKGAKKTEVSQVKTEDVGTVVVTLDEFRKLILEGQFTEIAGLATYFLAQLRGFL